MTAARECFLDAFLKNSFGSFLFINKLNITQKDRPKGTLENLSRQYQYEEHKVFTRHFNLF